MKAYGSSYGGNMKLVNPQAPRPNPLGVIVARGACVENRMVRQPELLGPDDIYELTLFMYERSGWISHPNCVFGVRPVLRRKHAQTA